MTTVQDLARDLGAPDDDPAQIKEEIARLRKKSIIPLEHVRALHQWLDSKRKARQSCRILGASRTGKTFALEAYFYRYKPIQSLGSIPQAPIVYIHPPQKCGPKDFFKEIIEFLKFRAISGNTTAGLRHQCFDILQKCQVEMLILDEADRLKPETFADVRDIYDKLDISVVLVGTDRLDTVIRRDEQVFRRFRASRRFEKLSGVEFTKTVKIWEANVLKLPAPSNLSHKSMLKILMKATEGYIGGIDEVLREAAIRALISGKKKIDKSLLEEVAGEYV